MAFHQYAEKLGHKAKLEAAKKATQAVYQILKKIRGETPQDEESPTAKTERLKKVEVVKAELEIAKTAESTIAGPAYDLFRKLLRDDPETQWDRIVSDMHSKNPWEDLKGYKRMNLCPKSYVSLLECIEFHKHMFFTVDAVEKLRYYLMRCIKKLVKVTIKAHVTRMEILNKYIGMLPTIKNSSLAVASTERGNSPFTEATHASIILLQLPVLWRNQYDLTHQTLPESPRVMLQDLETIEKVITERYNDKARTNKVKAATAPNANELRVPKKRCGEGSKGGTRKKGWSDKFCKWCKAVDGSFTTHDTKECRRFLEDCSPKDKPTKSFGSGKKTWKKTGTGDSDQVAYLTERLSKLEKKQKKVRKHKKRVRDSSDSDSNSD